MFIVCGLLMVCWIFSLYVRVVDLDAYVYDLIGGLLFCYFAWYFGCFLT